MPLDPQRTVSELRELQRLTGDENGAQRVAWTDTWVRAQDWMAAKLEGFGLETEFDEARKRVLDSHRILAELGLVQAHAAHAIALAEVEIIAGDLAAAERHLRWGHEQLSPLGDRHSISNIAWRLALVAALVG